MECLVKKVTRLFVFICVNSITFVFTLMTAGAAEQFASGTFTDSQFEAGAVIYAQLCASCHGQNAEGGVAAALTASSKVADMALASASPPPSKLIRLLLLDDGMLPSTLCRIMLDHVVVALC